MPETEGEGVDGDEEVDREVNEAADQALGAPTPEPASAVLHVFSAEVDPCPEAFHTAPQPSGDAKTMVDLPNACLRDEMARDRRILVFGEDVADCSREAALNQVKGKGGVF